VSALRLERHVVDSDAHAGYEADVAKLLDAMRTADGFLWADAARSLTEPDVFTLVSEWRTEVDLERFAAGEAYAAFGGANDVRLVEPASVRTFNS
jgi:quinol monooxygenase YgiN